MGNTWITVNEWIKLYDSKKIDGVFSEDSSFGWYDWFCSDASLKNRTKKLIPKVKFLVKYGIIDGDKFVIWMKNNCPFDGITFDDIRLNRVSDGEFIGGFSPYMGYDNLKGRVRIWFLGEKHKDYEFENWKEFKELVKSGEFTTKFK